MTFMIIQIFVVYTNIQVSSITVFSNIEISGVGHAVARCTAFSPLINA